MAVDVAVAVGRRPYGDTEAATLAVGEGDAVTLALGDGLGTVGVGDLLGDQETDALNDALKVALQV